VRHAARVIFGEVPTQGENRGSDEVGFESGARFQAGKRSRATKVPPLAARHSGESASRVDCFRTLACLGCAAARCNAEDAAYQIVQVQTHWRWCVLESSFFPGKKKIGSLGREFFVFKISLGHMVYWAFHLQCKQATLESA